MKIHEIITRRSTDTTALQVTLSEALRDFRLGRARIHHPLVSFVVTSHNYGHYIGECLRSVSCQSYDHWECIVVDDVSTDGTVACVKKFIEKSEKKGQFQLICRAKNAGQMEAFRDGLKVARGSFVVMLDADDVLLEDFLESHMLAHLSVRTVAFTSSNQYQINALGEVIGGQHMDHQSKGYYRHVTKTRFQRGFWVWATSSSMVFRRSTVELILPRDETTFRICADYYIAHFCHLVGDSLLIPTIHGCYRRHGKNNFGSNPVLGNINSVGNLDRHPPHDLFRNTMIHHILNNHELFYAVYGKTKLVELLLRLVKITELPRFAKAYPKIFPLSLPHYLLLAAKEKLIFMRTPAYEKFKILPKPASAASVNKMAAE